jgi:hypothetical protein
MSLAFSFLPQSILGVAGAAAIKVPISQFGAWVTWPPDNLSNQAS